MKAQGFTLVELLAVIVILAVLALIATPVVLSIIDDTKESAMLRSAEMYLSGVENAVMRENMNTGGNFRPNQCSITSEGNLDCEGKDGIIEVEVNGEKPKNGNIVFENGKIKEVTLTYESGTIVKDPSGNLVYEGSNSNITYESLGNYEHKLSNGTIESHDTKSGTCSKCEEMVLAPGLYDENGVMTMNWDEIINNNVLTVSNGEITGFTWSLLKGSLVIDNSINSIGSHSLYDSNNLTSIIIPNSVTNIGECAFFSSYNLTSVQLPNNLKKINTSVFENCYGLTSIGPVGSGASVEIPNSLTEIGIAAFASTGLTVVEIPDNVTTIGSAAFLSCNKIETIIISKNTTAIDSNAFTDNSSNRSLKSIVIDKDNPNYDSRNNCDALIETSTNTLILGSINTIIPNTITTLGPNAFYGFRDLTTIDIPESITYLDGFGECINLKTINYNGTYENWLAITKSNTWNYNCGKITLNCTDIKNITIDAFW